MASYDVVTFSRVPAGQIGEALYVFRRDGEGRVAVAHPLTLTTVQTAGGFDPQKAFLATGESNWPGTRRTEIDHFLQAMMDAAWDRGLRPKNFKPDERELAAVRDHLQDMRLLAKVPKAAERTD